MDRKPSEYKPATREVMRHIFKTIGGTTIRPWRDIRGTYWFLDPCSHDRHEERDPYCGDCGAPAIACVKPPLS